MFVSPTDPPALARPELRFLEGGGEMGRLIRAHDWAATPLGPPEGWPPPLRTAVRLILNTSHPMYIWWGPSLLCFYNDAYRRSIGPERHPASLGQPGRAVWDEIWPIIGPQVEQVMSGGGSIWQENALVPITRGGRREQVYWTYSFSPIDEEAAANGVGGVLVVCVETTDQVLAEREAATQRNRQLGLLNQMPGFVAVLRGPEHVYEFVNNAYVEISGARDFIGRGVREVFPELAGQGFYELLDTAYATGERFVARALPVRLATQPELRFIDLLYEPTRDATGAIDGIFVGGYDVTEQKKAEAKMALSEESLRLTTEAAEIGTWDLDLVTNTLTRSGRTKAMFGVPVDTPSSLEDFFASIHPDDREPTRQAFARAVDPAVRAPYDVQYRRIGPDGTVTWLAAKGRGLFDDNGICTRALGTVIDISARKLDDARHAFMLKLSDVLRGADTDTALTEASALMGEFFGVTRVGYGHLDPVEDVFDYSICWAHGVPPLLGRFPAAAFGVKIVERLGAGKTVVVGDLQTDDLSDEPETRATAAAVDTSAILVVPFVRAGRLRTIVYLNDRNIRQWRDDEIAFMEEVAERTRQVIQRGEAEAALRALNVSLEARVAQRTAELRAAEEALHQSQKMEAIGQLTGGIAHDFNNLLQAITGNLQVLRRHVAQGRVADLDRFVGNATTAADRAAALTHRLLAFARRQPLDPHPVAANPLVASMEELLRRTLGEAIELRLSQQPDLWQTLCDPNQLEAAILNLAINARDAMPGGGRLTIATANVHLAASEALHLGELRPGDYVRIAVADTGTGMDAEILGKAFEPFFTTKPLGQGTGLGLSMIYGFARQSGGHARIDSAPGEGATVTLYLPRFVGEETEPGGTAAASAAPAPAAGETVLVVEDEEAVRELVTSLLDELGYRVVEAGDGPSGLAILQSSLPIDLLITDVGLPGLNGRQIADAARALRPALKVLFMTGYAASMPLASDSLASGMELIAKPFTLDALAARVQEMLRSR